MIDLETKGAAEQVVNQSTKGSRGEVGVASASKTIKKQWHDVKTGVRTSLKTFARRLLKDGSKVAEDWMACKHGDLNASRSEKNQQRADLERSATKAAKRKTSKK